MSRLYSTGRSQLPLRICCSTAWISSTLKLSGGLLNPRSVPLTDWLCSHSCIIAVRASFKKERKATKAWASTKRKKVSSCYAIKLLPVLSDLYDTRGLFSLLFLWDWRTSIIKLLFFFPGDLVQLVMVLYFLSLTQWTKQNSKQCSWAWILPITFIGWGILRTQGT